MKTPLIVGSSLVACVLAVGLAVVVASPSEEPTTQGRGAKKGKGKAKAKANKARSAVRDRREELRAKRQEGKEQRAEKKEELLERREAKAARKNDGREEKALARAELRAEQLDELLLLHDDVAADLGLDGEVADELAILLMDTSDLIGEQLEKADLGEVPWVTAKENVAAIRQGQVDDAEALLGELFIEWREAMGFQRFEEEEF